MPTFQYFITAETEEDVLDSVLEEVEDSVKYNDIEYEITEV